ncbi:MAG: DUF1801 domain-containing protein [Leadbetterella sp.]|nr:DUF1801 domain-containing protein [Leadbetterella sp.]
MKKYTNVEEYILDFPEIAQIKMQELREIIASIATNCKEIISYNMPAYKQNGIVVYFAANKNHIGFYPTPNGITAFESQLTNYKYSKGAIQFPIDQPLPKKLIQDILRFRIEEDFLKKKK